MANLGFTAKTYDPLAEKLKMLNNAPKVTAGQTLLKPAIPMDTPMPDVAARPDQTAPAMPAGEKMNFWDVLALGMGGLGGTSSQNLQKMALAKQERIREAEKLNAQQKIASEQRNRTIQALVEMDRKDLAQGVQSGLLSPVDAAKMAYTKQELPAAIREAQWYLNNPEAAQQLKDLGIIGKGGITINTGDQTAPAKAQPGTQVIQQDGVYTQVPMYGSDAANQVKQAIVTAQNTLDVIDKTLADKAGLAAAVGPIDARTPSYGADATRFETYHNQLKGKAFLQAFESLKGGGQITEIEGQKAEQAISRLNLALSEKDYESALKELRQVVEAGLSRSKDQWNMIPKPEGSTGANNDPLGIRQQ